MDRPEFTKLVLMLKDGDTLVVTKLDRIARSTAEGLKVIDEFLAKGIKVNILNMGMLDTHTSIKSDPNYISSLCSV